VEALSLRLQAHASVDFVLTDWLTRGWTRSDQYPDGFREPPKTEWFLAHPSVGVEYASAQKATAPVSFSALGKGPGAIPVCVAPGRSWQFLFDEESEQTHARVKRGVV
jgi:hypothetical protein